MRGMSDEQKHLCVRAYWGICIPTYVFLPIRFVSLSHCLRCLFVYFFVHLSSQLVVTLTVHLSACLGLDHSVLLSQHICSCLAVEYVKHLHATLFHPAPPECLNQFQHPISDSSCRRLG